MRNLRTIAATGVAVVFLTGASGASASTEVGANCIADTAAPGLSVFQTAKDPASSGSLAIPSAGVITKWKVSLIPVPFSLPEQLKVFRPTADPKQFQVVGESTSMSVSSGENAFDTRVPVQAGDLIGLFGSSAETGTLFCSSESPLDRVAAVAGSPGVGTAATVTEEENELQGAVRAVVEPDADGDGYGDETQDKCPQNAGVQVPCPVVTLSASSTARKGLATVLITANIQATVTVNGTVKLGKGKSAKLSGATQVVAPGTIAKFTLLFSKKLKSALKELPTKRSLSLNVTATAPNVVGAATTSNLTVKLKGQAKPKSHKVKGSRH
jgi:hypothetical protein